MKTRKMAAVVVPTAFMLIAVVGVSPGQSSKTTVPSDVEQAVLDRMGEIQSAAESLDPDKVFSFVLENDAGALAQNGVLFRTRKEALESTKLGFQGLQKVRYQFDQQYVSLLSPTVALATGEGLSTATLDDGREFTTRFAQSVVFVLTSGEWNVIHSHRSFPRSE